MAVRIVSDMVTVIVAIMIVVSVVVVIVIDIASAVVIVITFDGNIEKTPNNKNKVTTIDKQQTQSIVC